VVRLAVDFEFPSREWWENGGRELWEGVAEGADAAKVIVDEDLARSWLAQAARIEGWNAGAEYAPRGARRPARGRRRRSLTGVAPGPLAAGDLADRRAPRRDGREHRRRLARLDGYALTARGRAQAERVAARLARECSDLVAVHTSDLRRARSTRRCRSRAPSGSRSAPTAACASSTSGAGRARPTGSLTEHRLWDHMRADPHYAPHGGESPLGVAERVCEALRRIALRHPAERVVAVSHGGALSLAFGLLLDGDCSQWRRVMDNGAVTELTLEPLALLRFNDTSHLDEI
jgi:probable phosphoglycerate mutase